MHIPISVFTKKFIRRQLPFVAARENGFRLIGSEWKSYKWNYLYRFIESRGLLGRKEINVFTDLVARHYVKLPSHRVKIWATAENIHNLRSSCWEDNGLGIRSLQLSVGFDYIDSDPRYVRYPCWIPPVFGLGASAAQIRVRVKEINEAAETSVERSKFAAFVAKHDVLTPGLRARIADDVENAGWGGVRYAGDFRHNDDSLRGEFNNDKVAYLKDFRYNICPENSNSTGYVTEKCLQAIISGCVPIYWGSDNNPEPGILNKDAILFCESEGDNARLLAKIGELESNKKLYREFASQPRFLPEAADIIIDMNDKLEKRLREIL